MRPYELILRKRNGKTLLPEEIASIIRQYTEGSLPDYQMSALLMAIFFQGLAPEELASWTDAMLRSGEVLDLSNIPGVKVDKHSTGGVGDKVSLPLAPLAASLGVVVPMVSGRGLGHTGGTLDKLESIPGFRTDLSLSRFRDILKIHGACLIGQTSEIAPADKKLYSLRDVTGTVDSIPLIASSIMSKKLAEGIDALVLDVKFGKGAFMKTQKEARVLAQTMLEIGVRMKKQMRIHLTAMDQPLGNAIGNSLEVKESIEVLQGKGPEDLVSLTITLASEMLLLAKKASSLEEASSLCQNALQNGIALKQFQKIVEAQGGDPNAITNPDILPSATIVSPILSPKEGFVTEVHALEIGLAAVSMGAGRSKKEDTIDPGVGIVLQKKTGDFVRSGEPLAILHQNQKDPIVEKRILQAFQVETNAPTLSPLLVERLAGDP